MRVAALILGILGGLYGLSIASLGAFIVIAGGGASRNTGGAILLYAIPVASLIGGGVAMSSPGGGALLMFLSTAGWYWIGSQMGYGINFVTFGSMALSGVGGLLALGAALEKKDDAKSDYSVGRINITRESRFDKPAMQNSTSPVIVRPSTATQRLSDSIDWQRWNALLKYDDDIARVADKIRPLGQKWVEEFARSYLALNDKQYLPNIIRKIIDAAQAEERAPAPTIIAENELSARQSHVQGSHLSWKLGLVGLAIILLVGAVYTVWKFEIWSPNGGFSKQIRHDFASGASAPLPPPAVITQAQTDAPSAPLPPPAVITQAQTDAPSAPPLPARDPSTAANVAQITHAQGGSQLVTYNDPFMFCRALINVDNSEVMDDKHYVGGEPPKAVTDALKMRPVAWRCMDGDVYGCYIGASGRSCMKMTPSKNPLPSIVQFCAQSPNADFVPMSMLGNSASSWRCQNTKPMIIQTQPLDKRGYVRAAWQKVLSAGQ